MNSESKRRFTPIVTVIILFGFISMLGDVVYEAARSANSQYLNLLGISAAKVGLVFGIGEFIGYFLRLVAGVLSDKSGKHWAFIFIGYGMLLVVPLIGFTMDWDILIILILIERIGKSLRVLRKIRFYPKFRKTRSVSGLPLAFRKPWIRLVLFCGH